MKHVLFIFCFLVYVLKYLCPLPIDFIPIWLIQILTSKLPLLKKKVLFSTCPEVSVFYYFLIIIQHVNFLGCPELILWGKDLLEVK